MSFPLRKLFKMVNCRAIRSLSPLNALCLLVLIYMIVSIIKDVASPISPVREAKANPAKTRKAKPYNLEELDDIELFMSLCQKEDLFRLKHLKLVNASIPVRAKKKAKCPRVLSTINYTVPLTALISYPGSGNTWTRHMIQQLTGLPTGSVYKDPTLKENGFPLEGKSENAIVVKTHGGMFQDFKNFISVREFDKMIVILRNPYDCLLSEFKRCCASSNNHTLVKKINTSSKKWKEYLPDFVAKWAFFMSDTFDFNGPILIVFYEDLRSQLLREMVRIADFLKGKHLQEFSFCCVLKEREGQFHRKSTNQTVTSTFNKEWKKKINKLIGKAAQNLYNRFPLESKRVYSFKVK